MRRKLPSHGRAAALLLIALAACVTPPAERPDPWQGMNRGVFAFNEGVDRYLLAPASKGWTTVTPRAVRVALARFFRNARFPMRFTSSLGQGELRQSGRELARFLVNTTVGLAGFFDPAGRLGLVSRHEDIGQMFARWGVGSGPYWVLPVFGPRSPRHALGWVFDSVLTLPPPPYGTYGTPLRLINRRALRAHDIETARRAALDYYVLVREAYLQQRRALIRNEAAGSGEADGDDDLYDLQDELDEGEDEPDEAESNGGP